MPMSLPMNQTRETSRHPSLDRLNRLIDLKNDTEPLKKFETPLYSYDDSSENRFWGIADRDVPILIGAAAGAVGLVFLILGAVLIWYCCQFVFKSDKDMYSLDYESDRASDSSEGTLQPFSDAVLFTGRKATRMDPSNDYIKRSQSAPLNVNKLGLGSKRTPHGTLPGCRPLTGGRKVTSGQMAAMSPNSIFTSTPMNTGIGYDRRMILGHSTFTHSDAPSDYGSGTDLTTGNSSIAGSLRAGALGHNSNRYKSYLFTPTSNTISQTVDNKIFQLHSGSSLNRYLNHSSPCRSIDEEEEAEMALTSPGDGASDIVHDGSVISVTITDTQSRDVLTEVISPLSTGVKVNFSKKRRNRMLDDSAAAIAINRTSIGNNNLSSNICSFNTSGNLNDTDTLCLVENESVVVYKERTDL